MLDQKIINLYDEYTHKPLTRKDFMVRLVQLAGSTTAALSMLAMLEPGRLFSHCAQCLVAAGRHTGQ